MIEKLGQLAGGFGNATESGERWGKVIGYYIQELTKGFVDFFKKSEDGTSQFGKFKEKAVEMYNVVKPIFRDLAIFITAIASSISSVVRGIQAISSKARGIGASLADMTVSSGSPSGTRASGGGVSAGSSYMVGERGAELFTPTTSGSISPSASSSTSITNIYTSASAHGIDTALASRGDSISRGSRVGLSVGGLGMGGYINLSTARARA